MSTVIRTAAGVARPLLSGGYAVDCGDPFPTFTPDRDHAKALLAVRTTTQARTSRGEGQVGPEPTGDGPTRTP